MKSGVSGVEIRDNIGMSRVKQTPQNMTWQTDLNATNWRLTWHIKWGGYVAYGPGPNATYTIRHIFFFKSWCHAWHTHAWHTHFNMLSIICGAAFIRDISREVQIFLCTGGKFAFLPKWNFNFICLVLKCFHCNMYNFLVVLYWNLALYCVTK